MAAVIRGGIQCDNIHSGEVWEGGSDSGKVWKGVDLIPTLSWFTWDMLHQPPIVYLGQQQTLEITGYRAA